MADYLVPARSSQATVVEKRSEFIGCVWPVKSEEEARAHIEEMRRLYHDARHHCWCYRIRETGAERYSDDGEPQGTAGQPMLGVFQRENVTDVCCVVTRYFGGVLLGAGGLLRAYTQSAKQALDAAGIAAMRPWTQVELSCPYALFERVRQEVELQGGRMGESEYAADVTVRALIPAEALEPFTSRITELTAGGTLVKVTGETLCAAAL